MQLFDSPQDVKSQTISIRFVYNVYLTPYTSQRFRDNKYWIGKDENGSSRGLIYGTGQEFALKT